jgi:hypothetical protein
MELKDVKQLVVFSKERNTLTFNDLDGIRFSLSNDGTQVILYLSPNNEKAEK